MIKKWRKLKKVFGFDRAISAKCPRKSIAGRRGKINPALTEGHYTLPSLLFAEMNCALAPKVGNQKHKKSSRHESTRSHFDVTVDFGGQRRKR